MIETFFVATIITFNINFLAIFQNTLFSSQFPCNYLTLIVIKTPESTMFCTGWILIIKRRWRKVLTWITKYFLLTVTMWQCRAVCCVPVVSLVRLDLLLRDLPTPHNPPPHLTASHQDNWGNYHKSSICRKLGFVRWLDGDFASNDLVN